MGPRAQNRGDGESVGGYNPASEHWLIGVLAAVGLFVSDALVERGGEAVGVLSMGDFAAFLDVRGAR